MTLAEATSLLAGAPATGPRPETWADLGCGAGLFTFALAQSLPPGSLIHAVDKEPVALQPLPNPKQVELRPCQFDFVQEGLPFQALDGVLMANSLHFVRDKTAFLQQLAPLLRPTAQWLIVEYDTLRSNPWVPFPIDFAGLRALFATAGYRQVRKLGERPSLYSRAPLYATLITHT
ncbi:MAG: class I SAM-dependent methyltransferase [Saprospiraceae bacterium]|nr:class I SAM-dependent methyltransferase [Saprospiraceae bacterium]